MKIALTIPGFGKLDSGLPSGVPTGGLEGTGSNAIGVLIEFLLIAAVLFSIYSLIRGGINMITSGGIKEKFQIGRERARYAIIGLFIVFASFFIINLIGSSFGINLLSNKSVISQCSATTNLVCRPQTDQTLLVTWNENTQGLYQLKACPDYFYIPGTDSCKMGTIIQSLKGTGIISGLNNPGKSYKVMVRIQATSANCNAPTSWSEITCVVPSQ